MKTFCLHHTDKPERKTRLAEALAREGMNDVEWIEDFHPSTIDVAKLDIRHKLNMPEVSVYLKHQKCFESQKKYSYENILVLEDDVLIPSGFNFSDFLTRAMKDFEEMKGDLMFIGGAFNIKPRNISPEQIVYSEPGFRSRCAHCYVVSHRCIDSLLQNINIMDDALDWKLNKTIEECGLKVCYTEPSIAQATAEGLEPSTIGVVGADRTLEKNQ
jgi:GR25 family glycosyltransferase involved in LPS biosynthesis